MNDVVVVDENVVGYCMRDRLRQCLSDDDGPFAGAQIADGGGARPVRLGDRLVNSLQHNNVMSIRQLVSCK